MLHFASRVALGVDVGDFFQLQRAFESDGEMDAAAEIKKVAGGGEARGQMLALSRAGAQDLFDLGGDFAQLFDESDGALGIDAAAELAQLERQQEECGELRGEGLGGGNADFRAGVGIDGAVSLARHHGVNHVADGHSLGAEGDHLALRGEGVGGFAGLGDEQAERVAVGDGVAIAVLAGIIDIDGQAGEALDHVFAGLRGVPTGAAGGDVDAGGGGQLLVGDLHLAQVHFAGIKRDASQRGVGNGARLLPDFLEHEVLVAALFCLDGVPRNSCDIAVDGVAVEVGEFDAGQGEDGHVAIGQEVDVARVVEHAGDIGGDERLAFANADDHGRTEARGDDLVGLGGGEHAQGKGAGEPLDRAADGYFERNGSASGFGILLDLLNEMGDDLGVGLGDEVVAERDEFVLQIEVILHNSVVHHDNAAGTVAMGVGVFFRGPAMRGPTGVAYTEGAMQGILAQHLFQIGELAGRAPDFKHGAGRTADGDTRRIVAAVFEPPQPLNDDGDYLLGTNVTDDSAHTAILCDGSRGGM